MFFLFGFQTIKTPVKNGLAVRRQCLRCGFISDLHEYRARSFFMLFFVPVFPLSSGQEVLLCGRCHAQFALREEDYLAAGKAVPPSLLRARIASVQAAEPVITCAFCKGKLRLPLRHKRLLVTCPHCREQFNYVPKL